MQIALKETRLGLRNSSTRLPFRYGSVTMTRCPQAVMQVTIETGGQIMTGYSGDCLTPGWFDKSPEKDYARQIDDMLAAIGHSEQVFREEFAKSAHFFPSWRVAWDRIHDWARKQGFPSLLACFGASLVERAMIDAAARAVRMPFHKLIQGNLLGLEPGQVHTQLAGKLPANWLPQEPLTTIFVRHTVGLVDPLTTADIPAEERLDDGYPQSLEEYLTQTGIRFLKIKVSNHLEVDLQRLQQIAQLVERQRGPDYRVTLDGNEQYHHPSEFNELVDAIRSRPELATLLANTLVIEQPFSRHIALDPKHMQGLNQLSATAPVIIDESDESLDAYPQALDLGYRGVSSKNCKGTIKSLLNMGLTWIANDHGQRNEFVMTGEDLCTVGVVPVQADLCLVATLGLTHIERNGHHYHPGLNYLSEPEQQVALAAHGDFYARRHGRITPHVVDGQFQIGSLQCPGFGFAALPEMSALQSPQQWQFSSLGL